MIKKSLHILCTPFRIAALAAMTAPGALVSRLPNFRLPRAEAAPADMPQTGQPLPGTGGGNATAMSDIHDIKPVLALDSGLAWLYWLLGALALFALLALLWWWRRLNKPEITIPAAPVIPPEQEAYQALDNLAAETGLTPKQFYFRLSSVVRHYTERRFEFQAAEMTTEELLPRIDRLALEQDLTSELKTFCRTADPIKFADAPAERQRMTHDLDFARDYVRRTTVVEPVENEEEPMKTPEQIQVVKTQEQAEPKKEIPWGKAE